MDTVCCLTSYNLFKTGGSLSSPSCVHLPASTGMSLLRASLPMIVPASAHFNPSAPGFPVFPSSLLLTFMQRWECYGKRGWGSICPLDPEEALVSSGSQGCKQQLGVFNPDMTGKMPAQGRGEKPMAASLILSFLTLCDTCFFPGWQVWAKCENYILTYS